MDVWITTKMRRVERRERERDKRGCERMRGGGQQSMDAVNVRGGIFIRSGPRSTIIEASMKRW